MEIFITFLSTLIGSYFLFKKNDKANQLKFITAERQKWREKIRELSVAFMTDEFEENEHIRLSDQKLMNIREQIAVRLNPRDDHDKYILCLMDCFINNTNNRNEIRIKLSIAFSNLLKHDWDRVKIEAKMQSNSVKMLIILISIFLTNLFFHNSINGPLIFNFEHFFISNYSFFRITTFNIFLFALLFFTIYELLKFIIWYFKSCIENHNNFEKCDSMINTKNNKNFCNSLFKYFGCNIRY